MNTPSNQESFGDEALLLRLATAVSTLVALPREFVDEQGRQVRINGLPPDIRKRFMLWYGERRDRYGNRAIFNLAPEAVWYDWIAEQLMG